MVVDAIPASRRQERLRRFWDSLMNKLNETLEDTGIYRRRSADATPAERQGGMNIPSGLIVGLILYLVAQGVGGIWWAATMQSRVETLQIENGKLWDRIGLHDLQQNKIENNFDERVRGQVREALTDWGYIHIPRKGVE